MALKQFNLVLLHLATLSNAYTVFETNCTTPSKQYNFVSSAENRGTLTILWSCLFTILACTWTVQHLNVPEQREGRDPGIIGDIKWASKRTGKSVKWMIVTVLAPELLLGKNLGDLRNASHDDHKELERLAAEDGVPWTRTHTLFANMGGFVIRSDAATRHTGDCVKPGTKEQASLIGPQSGEAALEATDSSSTSYPNPFHLTTPDILALRKAGHLATLPNITKEEINDKGKCDSFGRLIAVFQIFWMILQIIIRAWRHLAISQLEISVVAFSVCAIVLYSVNWEKPKNPEFPITLLRCPEAIPSNIIDLVERSHQARRTNDFGLVGTITGLLGLLFNRDESAYHQSMGPYRLNHILVYGSAAELFGCLLGCAIFGSVHLLAWNFAFPSTIERTLWRAAGVYCTAEGLIFILSGIMTRTEDYFENYFADFIALIASLVVLLSLILYVIARLFLIVEMFRTLCFLPPDAYIGTFASNFPHVG